MKRDDIRGRQAPAHFQRLLTRHFGRTPFGEPRYRLVWAPARIERSGGLWVDWDRSTSAAERQRGLSAAGTSDPRGVRPLRRVLQMRLVPKYPGEECWLVERWLPASSYGTAENWYAPAACGGTVLRTEAGAIACCGDYPSMGDYEDIGARMYWYPNERHLLMAVNAVERGLEQMPATAAGRARRRTYRAQQEQEKRDLEFDQAAAELFDEAAPAFAGAALVGYGGSHRPALVEMAERIGIRQHPL